MKGIYYLVDEKNNKRFLQIDLDVFDKEYIQDFLDGLVANSRKDEPSIPLEDVIQQLKEDGIIDETL